MGNCSTEAQSGPTQSIKLDEDSPSRTPLLLFLLVCTRGLHISQHSLTSFAQYVTSEFDGIFRQLAALKQSVEAADAKSKIKLRGLNGASPYGAIREALTGTGDVFCQISCACGEGELLWKIVQVPYQRAACFPRRPAMKRSLNKGGVGIPKHVVLRPALGDDADCSPLGIENRRLAFRTDTVIHSLCE